MSVLDGSDHERRREDAKSNRIVHYQNPEVKPKPPLGEARRLDPPELPPTFAVAIRMTEESGPWFTRELIRTVEARKFWELAFCAAISRWDGDTSYAALGENEMKPVPELCAEDADAALAEWRKRFDA